MATDRTIRKQQEAGVLNSPASSTANSLATIAAIHTRSLSWTKSGSENSSNNVAETAMFVVNRAAVVKSVKLLTNSGVANASADGFVVTVAKRTGAGAAVTVATWNTDSATGAQGTITAFVAASLSVVTSSDSTLAAGDVLTFKCAKYGVGKLLDSPAAVVVDVEEV